MIKNCNDCGFWKQIKGHFRSCGYNDGMKCKYFMADEKEEQSGRRGRMGDTGRSHSPAVYRRLVQRFR